MNEQDTCNSEVQLEVKDNNDIINENTIEQVPVKKKRGRKPKVKENVTTEVQNIVPKKRGRKPKGGKIVENINDNKDDKNKFENVILQLKCNTTSLDENNTEENLESYSIHEQKQIPLNFQNLNETDINNNNIFNENSNQNNNQHSVNENNSVDIKLIWKKIKELQKQFHFNENYSSKKSACFWCTYDFSNPPIYIPKNYINENYQVYGNFCSPECAVAYLMNEHIDSSQKFERYQMMNFLYGKIYNYEKNIKPAPNPYYLLERYYGNLTIQEYRQLFDNDRLLFVVDKPLTKILPEIHDENSDIMSVKNITQTHTTGNYQIKRKTNNTKSKNDSLQIFGFTT
tara:strand:+ start:567 stop:1595 length:1029 start_codon:yes stop_codon:yes gene_type:complete